MAFRTVGLPIHGEDFEKPFTPLGGNLEKEIPPSVAVDPKERRPLPGVAVWVRGRLFAVTGRGLDMHPGSFIGGRSSVGL